MNKAQLAGMKGKEVTLWPAPITESKAGNWLILDAVESGIQIKHTATDHQTVLGFDNIREFLSPNFLILKVQIELRGLEVITTPHIELRNEFNYVELSLLDELQNQSWKRMPRGSIPNFQRLFYEGLIEPVKANASHLFDVRQDFGVGITEKGRLLIQSAELKRILLRREKNKLQATSNLLVNPHSTSDVRIELNFESICTPNKQGNLNFEFRANIVNEGLRQIDKYQLHLEFPRLLLNESPNHGYAMEDKGRSTETHRFFKVSEAHHLNKSIDPGDNKLIIGFGCSMSALALANKEILREKIKTRFYYDGTLAVESVKEISQLLKLNVINNFD